MTSSMRDHVRRETADRLRRFAFEVGRAARFGDPETIHDLRVSIRRLRSCLRVFHVFYPPHAPEKIHARLGSLMDLAGCVRDCDIALELLAEGGVSKSSTVVERLKAERRQAAAELASEARRWYDRGFLKKWRARLKL